MNVLYPRRSTRLPETNHPYAKYVCAYKAKKSKSATNPDTLDWNQAMSSQFKSKFMDSAKAELSELVSKGTWFEDKISNATNKIVPCKWVFRIKRTSDGSIRKFIGRIVLRGDLQDDTGEDNYSPVAAWATIRCFLILSLMLGWITGSIDFSNMLWCFVLLWLLLFESL